MWNRKISARCLLNNIAALNSSAIQDGNTKWQQRMLKNSTKHHSTSRTALPPRNLKPLRSLSVANPSSSVSPNASILLTNVTGRLPSAGIRASQGGDRARETRSNFEEVNEEAETEELTDRAELEDPEIQDAEKARPKRGTLIRGRSQPLYICFGFGQRT